MQTSSLLFSSWDEDCVPEKFNVNFRSKIRDAMKRDERSSKLVPKSFHIQRKMFFQNKLRFLWKNETCKKRLSSQPK